MKQLTLVNENRLISILRDINRPIRVFISFTLVILLFLSWILFLYAPINNKVQRCKDNIALLKNDKDLAVKLISEMPKLEKDNGRLAKKINKKLYTIKESINYIFHLIHQNNLSCSKFVPYGDNQNSKQFSLTINGKYENIITVFDSLKQSSLSIKVLDFSLMSDDSDLKLDMHIKI